METHICLYNFAGIWNEDTGYMKTIYIYATGSSIAQSILNTHICVRVYTGDLRYMGRKRPSPYYRISFHHSKDYPFSGTSVLSESPLLLPHFLSMPSMFSPNPPQLSATLYFFLSLPSF